MTENERAARKKKIMNVVMWIILLILFVCFVSPFILVVINVFKTKADITSNPLALIGEHGFTLANFPEAMSKMNFWRVFGNSLTIPVWATVLTILIASMTAYVYVRPAGYPTRSRRKPPTHCASQRSPSPGGSLPVPRPGRRDCADCKRS